jgi:octaprenyl-diphosphate synthase
LDVKAVTAPVRKELQQFEKYFRDTISSDIGLVDTVVRYVVKRKGKRIRPALVMLSAGACGTISESSFRGASLVELLHTATLVHDDVVDEAETRRGLPSINATWKNKVAVLMGDYILARGLLLSLESNDVEFLRITSQSVRRMSEGELLQIQKSWRMNIDEETYYRIIGDKTASLLSTCCEIGAVSVNSDPEIQERMKQYGENLGMAFQIQDDILDFTGKESDTGKPVGGDVKEKKLTLPLIHAFTKAPAKANKSILRILKNGASKKNIGDIVSFVNEYGGIDYAKARAEEYKTAAIEAVSVLPDSACKQSLQDFATFVIDRSK